MADFKGGVTDSMSWLFENASEAQEKVERAIVATLQKRQITNTVKKKTYKSGMILLQTKKECLVINGDKTFEIFVSCMKVGSYLYVGLFRNEKKGFFSALFRDMKKVDLFRQQQCDAIFAAILDCCEDAFKSAEIWEQRTTEN